MTYQLIRQSVYQQRIPEFVNLVNYVPERLIPERLIPERLRRGTVRTKTHRRRIGGSWFLTIHYISRPIASGKSFIGNGILSMSTLSTTSVKVVRTYKKK